MTTNSETILRTGTGLYFDCVRILITWLLTRSRVNSDSLITQQFLKLNLWRRVILKNFNRNLFWLQKNAQNLNFYFDSILTVEQFSQVDFWLCFDIEKILITRFICHFDIRAILKTQLLIFWQRRNPHSWDFNFDFILIITHFLQPDYNSILTMEQFSLSNFQLLTLFWFQNHSHNSIQMPF